jgi:hypothetical protein
MNDAEVAMRTTLEIQDDVLDKVKEFAASRRISNGEAASELLRRGLTAEVPTKWENGILVFSPGSEGIVSVDRVMKLKDELESEPW